MVDEVLTQVHVCSNIDANLASSQNHVGLELELQGNVCAALADLRNPQARAEVLQCCALFWF